MAFNDLDDIISGLQGLISPELTQRAFWYTSSTGSLSKGVKDKGLQETVLHYQMLARKIKNASDTLNSLVRSLASELSNLHNDMYPTYLQHGLSNLPDELLAEILELCDRGTLNLRTVSRRFYNVVSRLPYLWARDKLCVCEIPKGRLDLHLKHSQHQLLKVHIVSVPGDARRLDVLHRLDSHWNRVGELQIGCFHDSDRDAVDVEAGISKLSSLDLPQLHQLTLTTIGLDIIPATRRRRSDTSFLESWFTPKLSSLRLLNVLPIPIPGMNLSRCTIELNSDETFRWDPLKISALLTRCPALEELVFRFEDVDFSGAGFHRITLAQLKSFQLIVSHDTWYEFPSTAVTNMLDNLHMANVQQMAIEVFIESDEQFNEFIDSFLTRNAGTTGTSIRYPNVDSLNLTFKRNACELNMSHILFNTFPRLRHFTIEARGAELVGIDGSTILSACPPLERICFRRCYQTSDWFFEDLFDVMHRWSRRRSAKTTSPSRSRTTDVLPVVVVAFEGCTHLNGIYLEPYGRQLGFGIEWRDSVD